MSPYFDTTFGGWFLVGIQRFFEIMLQLIHGKDVMLYSDEIQLIVLVSFGVVASFLGTLLLLKKMTMMANALSHTMLVGIVIAYLISHMMEEKALFFGAFLSTCLTVLLIQALSKSRHMTLDAANGMVFNFLFALGITLISLFCRDSHVGVEMITGNVDLLTQQDIWPVIQLSAIALVVGFLCLRGFIVSIFDPIFAKDSGLRPGLFDQLLLLLCGLTIISAFRAVGLVLVLVFFVVPALIARRVTTTMSHLILLAQGVTAGTCIVGIAFARHLDSVYALSLSTSALIAVMLSLEYVMVLLFSRQR